MSSGSGNVDISQIKVKLKRWELQFFEKNGRKPTKDDISSAELEIQEDYRTYYKFKRNNDHEKVSPKCAVNQDATDLCQSITRCAVWGPELNKSVVEKASLAKPESKSKSALSRFTSKLQANAVVLQRKASKQKFVEVSKSKCLGRPPRIAENMSDNREDLLPMVSACRIKCIQQAEPGPNKSKAVNAISVGSLKFSYEQALKSDMNWLTPNLDEPDTERSCVTRTEEIATSENITDKRTDKFIFEKENTLEKSVKNEDVRNPERNRVGSAQQNVPTEVTASGGESMVNSFPNSVIERSQPFSNGQQSPHDSKLSGQSTARRRKSGKRPADALNSSKECQAKNKRIRMAVESTSLGTTKRPARPTENYVRINLKKKVYCRGKRQFNYRRYKRGCWKQLQNRQKDFKAEPPETVKTSRGFDEHVAPAGIFEEGSCPSDPEFSDNVENLHSIADNPRENLEIQTETFSYKTVEPLFHMEDGNMPKEMLSEVHEALHLFGHDSFRPGQLEAVSRVLAGLSTLVIQPTGSGKSLCYLLPAYMYLKRSPSIALIVSPLVSLMEDQVARAPSCLRAACHHTSMTTTQRNKVKDAIVNGKVDVLFVSPESVVGGACYPEFSCLPSGAPPIAFVCIDEVHCVSAWSHNFRPTYLRLCRVIREVLKVRCVLGLTATATVSTIRNVAEHLGLPDQCWSQSIVRGTVLPTNLQLVVSRDQREEALLNILKSKPYCDLKSIIIYCIRREQTDRLAILIRTCLQQSDSEWTAESYHAGLTAARRRNIQKQFMAGELRVIVATVAFGMGLNKPDVRAVIHYNMPKCIESYVQEIGRAGRDGLPSYCHLFLDSRGEDRMELRRHIYGNTVDRATVSKLLRYVFKKCRCKKLQEMERMLAQESDNTNLEPRKCPGHEVAFSVESCVEELDVKEEGIETLLCYLELHPERPVRLLNRTHATCSILCYGGFSQLQSLAVKIPAVAVALRLNKKKAVKGKEENSVEFNLVEVAASLGCDSRELRSQLRKLVWTEYTAQGVTKYKKSGIIVQFTDLSFHLRAVGDLDDDGVDQYVDYLHARILQQETNDLKQLEVFHAILEKVSFRHQWACGNDDDLVEKSQQLKGVIQAYFEESQTCPEISETALQGFQEDVVVLDCDRVVMDIRRFLGIQHDCAFTGRALARIFHGIDSPRYPAKVWGRVRQFWRCHLDFDFNLLCRLATKEILRLRH